MKAVRTIIWVIITIAIITVCISFAMQNGDLMDLKILGWESGLQPKWILLFVFMGFGALLATLFFAFTLIKLETGNMRLRRVNKKLERALLKNKAEGTDTSAAEEILKGPDFDDDEDV